MQAAAPRGQRLYFTISSLFMNSLSITSLDPLDAERRASELATLSADVFASEPWNEAFKCRTCKKSFGRAAAGEECCGTSLDVYYPPDATRAYYVRCLQNTRSRIAVAMDEQSDNRLIGFALGWEDSLNGLCEKNFFQDEQVREVSENTGFRAADPLFYFSEFGVTEELRGQGIGKRLFNTLFSSVDWSTVRGRIMRTSRQSPAYSIASQNAAFPFMVVYQYRDALERIILTNPVYNAIYP